MVDVLDVDRTLVHAGAAIGARPQHVGVDHAVRRLGADQRTLGLLNTLSGSPSRADSGKHVRRLGEGVVAQVQDQHLRRERLLGVPRGALGLAAAALGAGREVEQALPGEVLDGADAELGILVEVVEFSMVTGLPPDIIGTAAPRASGWRPNITFTGAMKMWRCLECTTSTRNTSMMPM